MLTKQDLKVKYGDDIMLLFKGDEPFVETLNGSPAGVLVERDGRVCCFECGEWYKLLAPHVRRIHKISANEYKEKYGFNKHVGLCSKEVSRRHSEHMVNRMKNETSFFASPEGRKLGHEANRKFIKEKGKAPETMQTRNHHNTCPEQIKKRLQLLAIKFGDNMSATETLEVDPKLVDYAKRVYGGWNNMKKKLNYPVTERGKNNMKEFADLVYDLRRHVEKHEALPWYTGRSLMKHETRLHNFPHCRKSYQKHFGSLLKAYAYCGLKREKMGVYTVVG